MISALALLATLAAPVDTVRADSLLAELPAIVRFNLYVSPRGDSVPTLLVRSEPPAGARLGRLQRELRFAIAWLLEGAPSYNRAAVLRAHSGDSTAMRVELFRALTADSQFTRPLLRLAVPLLREEGTAVRGAPAYSPRRLSEDDAVALAARFFQLNMEEGELALTVCAKPDRLRGRPVPRDDAVEAWLYSAVRGGPQSGAVLDAASRAFASARAMAVTAPAAGDPQAVIRAREVAMWAQLQRSAELRAAIRDLIERTRNWAPAVLTAPG